MPRPATRAVHGSDRKDTTFNSVMTPLYPSSTFYFDRLGENKGFDYTRSGNPTRRVLEDTLASLEGGSACVCTATGMAAVVGVLHLLKPGDHVITGNDIYGGSYRLMHEVFSRYDIRFDFLDMTDPENVRSALADNTALIWIETPSNPMLRLVDIQAITAIARERQILAAVDNTFMSPYFQRPFELGADIIVHSTTKYINGHSDVVGGAIITNRPDLDERIAFITNACGLTESPWDAWLVLRGVQSLAQRMEAHAATAAKIAMYLNQHPKVKQTYYPGLESHPQIDLARKQMSGFGGMVSFDIEADKGKLDTFFSALRYFKLAESLGGVESLIESPWYMSHTSMSEQARRDAGIKPGTIRVSVGLEHADDLIEDLEHGLSTI
ncbi:MAG: PLP-dependent transferase [Phycisphaerales bacterium]|nr:MAG: PLP-dependent transferase [Phycisphaerales bacterium]